MDLFPFDKLRAGDSWTWTASDPDHLAPDWTLKFFFRGPANLDLTATPDGTGFKLSAAASQTSGLLPGTYTWAAVATKGPERVTLGSNSVEITPDIEKAAAGFDGRSFNKRCFDAIRAVLENRASAADKNYQIGGRSVGFMDTSELLKLKAQFETLVEAELNEGQRSDTAGAVFARFG